MVALIIGIILCLTGVLAYRFIRDDKIGSDAAGTGISVICGVLGVLLILIGILSMCIK